MAREISRDVFLFDVLPDFSEQRELLFVTLIFAIKFCATEFDAESVDDRSLCGHRVQGLLAVRKR